VAVILLAESIAGSVDEVNVVGGDPVAEGTIPLGGLVSIRGWLLNSETGKPVDRLEIAIGNGRRVDAVLGFYRPDVADALEWATSPYGGFYAVVPIETELGSQRMSATAYIDGTARNVESTFTFDVASTIDPIAGLVERPGGWAFSVDGFFSGEQCIDTPDKLHTTALPYDRPSLLRLWIIDLKSSRPPVTIIACLGGTYLPVFDIRERKDAADAVGLPNAINCGYRIGVLPLMACSSALHIYAVSVDGTYLSLPKIMIRPQNPLPSEVLLQDALISAHIDEVRVGATPLSGQQRVRVTRGERVSIRGWTVDDCGPRLSGGVEARVDQFEPISAEVGEHRSDIATLFGNSMLANSGFTVSLDTSEWSAGVHRVALRAFSSRGDRVKRFADLTVVIHSHPQK
jgi:hypothetical protein